MAENPSSKRIKLEERDQQVGMQHRLINLLAATAADEEGAKNNNNIVLKDFKPFQAILKLLYSDFIVREIPTYVRGAETQKALYLTEDSFKIPADAMDKDPETAAAAKLTGTVAKEDIEKDFAAVFERHENGADKIQELCKFVAGVLEDPKGTFEPFEFGLFSEKEKRTAVHQTVKKTLGERFVSKTDDKRPGVIILEKATKSNTSRRDRKDQNRHRNKFLHFTLYKENMDGNSALRNIANKLGLNTRQLQFSGMKDKRAVTLQRVACKELSAERLAQLNKASFGWQSAIKLTDFEYLDNGLQIGDANGNHFTITLRDPFVKNSGAQIPNDDVLRALGDALRQHGCVNYFGPQRFGTTSVLTSDVGALILHGDYKAAIFSIVKAESEITPTLEQSYKFLTGATSTAATADSSSREEVNTNGKREREGDDEQGKTVADDAKSDPQGALNACPHFCYNQRDMFRHLIQCPNDYLGCLRVLPRNLVMLYCHSLQSLLWNIMASTRIAANCRSVMEGDMVLVDENALEGVEGDGKGNAHLPATRTLAAEDVASGKFTLADVVLPVPGTDADLQYPAAGNVCSHDAYMQLIKAKGVEALVDKNHTLATQFHFHGTYRKLMLVPKDFQIERVVVEGGIKAPAVKTDRELILGDQDPVLVARNAKIDAKKDRREAKKNQDDDSKKEAVEEENAEPEKAEKEEGEEKPVVVPPPCVAIVVKFSLGSGSYATSVLRELCTVVHDPIE